MNERARRRPPSRMRGCHSRGDVCSPLAAVGLAYAAMPDLWRREPGRRPVLPVVRRVGAADEARGIERRIVTVIFVDLVGFTSRAERLDPEDVRAVLTPYHQRVRRRSSRSAAWSRSSSAMR